jgi:NMD protein affecting ribosome stability and mRNA decay
MRDCQFEGTDGKWVCVRCGTQREQLVRRNCKGTPLAGDIAKKMTSAVGVKPCSNCNKRARWLNRIDSKIRGRT